LIASHPFTVLSIWKFIMMLNKTFKACTGALALAAVMALPAQASVISLFNFDAQTPLSAPTNGPSLGFALVEGTVASGNNFTGVNPWVFGSQLWLDTAGSVSAGGRFVSSFSFNFNAALGGIYGFSYNFLTNNFGAGATSLDSFSVDLFSGSSLVSNLAAVNSLSSLSKGASPYGVETGIRRVQFQPVTPGNYTVQFALSTTNPACVDSLPSCLPTAAVVNGVPEPTSLALVALAIGAAGWISRRRSSSATRHALAA